MTAFLLLLYLTLFSWFLYSQWRRESTLKRVFLPALIVKLIGGMTIGLLYKYYYTAGDTFSFHADGVVLSHFARTDISAYFTFLFTSEFPSDTVVTLTYQEPRSLFLIKFISVLNLIGLDNYWITACYCSVFSFLGAWYLVKSIEKVFPVATVSAVVAFLFVPTVTLWTSGLIKEAFAMACLYFMTGFFLRIWRNETVSLFHWILTPIAAWVLWGLKYYFAAIFFPVIISLVMFRLVTLRFKVSESHLTQTFIWIVLLIVPIALMMTAHPNFYPQRFFDVIVDNYNQFQSLSNNRNVVRYNDLQPDFLHILLSSPMALFSGLFRPMIWEADNIQAIMASIENLLVMTAFAFALRDFPFLSKSPHYILLVAAITYVIVLCTFLTLSTPNFGTLCRYRVGYFPFFIFLILLSPRISYALQRSIGRLLKINS